MVSATALKEFREIYAEEIGEISEEQAMVEAANLLSLFDVVYRPIQKGWEADVLPVQTNSASRGGQ